MGRQALKGILHDIREAKVFALMVDEVTDVSGTEQMCISIRWVFRPQPSPEEDSLSVLTVSHRLAAQQLIHSH